MSRDEIIAYYHRNCFDGTMAAAIFLLRYPEATMYPYEYGEAIEGPDSWENKNVFLLDLTWDDEMLVQVGNIATSVTVIDHHPRAHDQLGRKLYLQGNIFFITDNKLSPASGAQLTWRYLFSHQSEPDAVRWVGKRDVWIFNEPEIRPFSFGVGTLGFDPHKWRELFFEMDITNDLLTKGEVLARQIDSQIEYFVDNCQETIEIDGHRVIAVNAPRYIASELAQALYTQYTVEESPFIAIYFHEKGRLVYSLRSSRSSLIHLGDLASKFGGGGHAHAAGFKVRLFKAPINPRIVMDPSPTYWSRFNTWLQSFRR